MREGRDLKYAGHSGISTTNPPSLAPLKIPRKTPPPSFHHLGLTHD